MATLAEHVAAAAGRLEQAGLSPDEAVHSAEVLARAVLGWSAADWLARRREAGPSEFPTRFLPLIDRRARREPVAYIVNEREFYGRVFKVTRDVLIPRAETELVVDEALKQKDAGSRFTIVDVGTGSGCIAITLALEAPDARVVATDLSEPALEVARENARRLGAADRVHFRHGEFLAGAVTPVDMIVSNPPYISESDRGTLMPEVAEFEPQPALFSGSDGLDTVRALAAVAARALQPGGSLILEIGQGQDAAVRTILEHTGAFTVDRIRPDLQGIPRVAVALRH